MSRPLRPVIPLLLGLLALPPAADARWRTTSYLVALPEPDAVSSVAPPVGGFPLLVESTRNDSILLRNATQDVSAALVRVKSNLGRLLPFVGVQAQQSSFTRDNPLSVNDGTTFVTLAVSWGSVRCASNSIARVTTRIGDPMPEVVARSPLFPTNAVKIRPRDEERFRSGGYVTEHRTTTRITYSIVILVPACGTRARPMASRRRMLTSTREGLANVILAALHPLDEALGGPTPSQPLPFDPREAWRFAGKVLEHDPQ